MEWQAEVIRRPPKTPGKIFDCEQQLRNGCLVDFHLHTANAERTVVVNAIVVDRLVVREGLEVRLADSFETALNLADGIAFVDDADQAAPEPAKAKKQTGIQDNIPKGRTVFSAKFACPVSGFTIPEIEPRLFSFNNPFGACPKCDGLGSQQAVDPKLVVPNEAVTLKAGAVAPWAKSTSPYYGQILDGLGRHYGFKQTDRWADLPEEGRKAILFGTGKDKVEFRFKDGFEPRYFVGNITFVPRLELQWI